MTAYSNNNIKNSATKAKKPIRKRRPRRELPADLSPYYIADWDRPTDLDVVAGRGGGANNHEGNKRYWRRILEERPGYKQLGKNDNAEKNEIARAIYDFILSTGGRFLQLEKATQKWFNIPERISLDKVKQALRDEYIPHFFKGENISAPVAKKTPIPAAPKPPALFSAPSLDLGSLLSQKSLERLDSSKFSLTNILSKDFNPFQQSSLNMFKSSKLLGQTVEDEWNRSSFNKSNDFSLQGNSLENLMRGDLIKTVDNMDMGDNVNNNMPKAPQGLQALLQKQMESAIPTSRSVTAV